LFEEPLDAKLNGRQVLPVTHIPAIRIPGKLLAMSSVENALPLQSKYNRLRSIMMEHSNLISGPKLVAAVGSLEGNTYDDRPLGVISYRPEAGGSAPFFATPGPLASYVLDSLRLIVTEMEDVFGVHDISQGRLPRRATSGVALSILEEKDNTVINPMKDALIKGLQRNFAIVLGIAKNKFSEERVMKILGRDGQLDVLKWSGSDLGSVDDVRVLKDSELPSSRAAKFELGINLANAGILDRRGALALMNLDSISDLSRLTPEQADETMAMFENFQMTKRIQVYPSEFENFEAHIQEHRKFLAEHPDFPDDVKSMLQLHLKDTEEMKALKNAVLTKGKTDANLLSGMGQRQFAPQSAPPGAPATGEESIGIGEGLEL